MRAAYVKFYKNKCKSIDYCAICIYERMNKVRCVMRSRGKIFVFEDKSRDRDRTLPSTNSVARSFKETL